MAFEGLAKQAVETAGSAATNFARNAASNVTCSLEGFGPLFQWIPQNPWLTLAALTIVVLPTAVISTTVSCKVGFWRGAKARASNPEAQPLHNSADSLADAPGDVVGEKSGKMDCCRKRR